MTNIENLGYGLLNEDGDVIPLCDEDEVPMSNRDRIARMHPNFDAAALKRDQAIIDTRSVGDFSLRNEKLKGMAAATGATNQYEGAASKMRDGGRMVPYRNADHAESLAQASNDKARILGAEACKACPLFDFCDIEINDVRKQLDEQKVRTRFTRRVTKPENNHFCRTNLDASRLNKLRA